ncbi:DUF885 domain-containing protein [Gilvibacter sediminis]|uniref:DUF885 domain-containing protein n=1 Tax=Gilvibacter sediminis TaxID=379071 RepID=UPI002350C566|nr:DUF885 domain-containing protein [Gilvibacter sediminis]MDC7998796.1 DUF885 domain-containing protein [Gilvibacter sediminis]
MRILISFSLILFTLLSCKEAAQEEPAADGSDALAQILEDYKAESYALYPWNATFEGDARFNDQLPNFYTQEFKEKEIAYYTKFKEAVSAIDDASLNESELLSKKILIWECERNLEGKAFPAELLPVDQFNSPILMFAQLGSGQSAQPFTNKKDYINWLTRLEAMIPILDTAIVNMKKGVSEGIVLPRALTQKVLPQIKSLVSESAAQSLFYSPIRMFPEDMDQAAKDSLTTAYTTMINEKLSPKLAELYDYIEKDYLAASRETSGYADIPGGTEQYNRLIKLYTTTDMTADEIHQLGLAEVARIRAEMEKVKAQVGFEGSLKEFFDHVRTNEDLMPFTDPQQVIDNFNAIHEKMKPQIDKLFDMQPKTAFEVRRTEKFREASASAQYNPGSLDGTRPGIFYVPIPDVSSYNIYSDEDLFLHEAIPGHHFQVSLTQENENLPQFRKTLWYSAYGEGWALYTESLGKELGLYDDPYQYFGMLSAEMHRAIRLVVDTGIHTKGWSREKAIQYSLDNEAESEASITSEIERYMAMPAQALSYKIGQLKILELRATAEQALGDNFDIKSFHNEVLESGCLPLALLEEKINAWINSLKP